MTSQVSRPEELVTIQAGNRPLIDMQLHSQDGPVPLQDFRDLIHAQLHVLSLRDQVVVTAMSNPLPRPINLS